ncbi:unnamed protein product [Pleuronectes platessa]|uniref:Uncharacterized protein n=1 Tax=Pleuronectes platessa TaxID=8262 RepID=A0A9N7V0H2_PLEPL|nr:unnamed protein product [Pleuronectes platessa]
MEGQAEDECMGRKRDAKVGGGAVYEEAELGTSDNQGFSALLAHPPFFCPCSADAIVQPSVYFGALASLRGWSCSCGPCFGATQQSLCAARGLSRGAENGCFPRDRAAAADATISNVKW